MQRDDGGVRTTSLKDSCCKCFRYVDMACGHQGPPGHLKGIHYDAWKSGSGNEAKGDGAIALDSHENVFPVLERALGDVCMLLLEHRGHGCRIGGREISRMPALNHHFVAV